VARTGAEKMVAYRQRKRAQGLRLAQHWTYDLSDPAVRERMRREAELVRDHASTREANVFLSEILDDILPDPDQGEP